MIKNPFRDILRILARLEEARIHYSLSHNRDEALAVEAAVPGHKWEIEILSDGTIEVEVFESDGSIYDETKIDELLGDFSD